MLCSEAQAMKTSLFRNTNISFPPSPPLSYGILHMYPDQCFTLCANTKNLAHYSVKQIGKESLNTFSLSPKKLLDSFQVAQL